MIKTCRCCSVAAIFPLYRAGKRSGTQRSTSFLQRKIKMTAKKQPHPNGTIINNREIIGFIERKRNLSDSMYQVRNSCGHVGLRAHKNLKAKTNENNGLCNTCFRALCKKANPNNMLPLKLKLEHRKIEKQKMIELYIWAHQNWPVPE